MYNIIKIIDLQNSYKLTINEVSNTMLPVTYKL